MPLQEATILAALLTMLPLANSLPSLTPTLCLHLTPSGLGSPPALVPISLFKFCLLGQLYERISRLATAVLLFTPFLPFTLFERCVE